MGSRSRKCTSGHLGEASRLSIRSPAPLIPFTTLWSHCTNVRQTLCQPQAWDAFYPPALMAIHWNPKRPVEGCASKLLILLSIYSHLLTCVHDPTFVFTRVNTQTSFIANHWALRNSGSWFKTAFLSHLVDSNINETDEQTLKRLGDCECWTGWILGTDVCRLFCYLIWKYLYFSQITGANFSEKWHLNIYFPFTRLLHGFRDSSQKMCAHDKKLRISL